MRCTYRSAKSLLLRGDLLRRRGRIKNARVAVINERAAEEQVAISSILSKAFRFARVLRVAVRVKVLWVPLSIFKTGRAATVTPGNEYGARLTGPFCDRREPRLTGFFLNRQDPAVSKFVIAMNACRTAFNVRRDSSIGGIRPLFGEGQDS